MKKLLLTLSLAISVTRHSATITKKLVCDNTNIIFSGLTSKFGERPVFVGVGTEDDKGTDVVLLVNSETGSWTLIQMKNDIACFLAMGDNATFNK